MNTELDLLIEYYLDGTISPEQLALLEELLLTDSGARRDFLLALAQILTIRDLASENSAKEQLLGTSRPLRISRRRTALVSLAIAACVTLLSALWWLLLPVPEYPSLTALSDGVKLRRANVLVPFGTESSLQAGDIVEVGSTSKAVLQYNDASRLELGPDTILSLPKEPAKGKLLQVERGSVNANVTKQPAGQPFQMRSATSMLEVVGTQFQLHVTDASTRLNVTEGAVLFQRLGDQAETKVSAGQQAIASGNATYPMRVATVDEATFQETFEENDLQSRGWYDAGDPLFSGPGATPSSRRTVEFRFPVGNSEPSSGIAIRRRMALSDAVCVSYWIKRKAGEADSGTMSEVRLMTNKDGDWVGPGRTHLTVTIGTREGLPTVWIQDSLNIDVSRGGQDLVKVSEARAVAGGNGDSDGHGEGDFYSRDTPGGPLYSNAKLWSARKSFFSDLPSASTDGRWHHVAVYLQLNQVKNGRGIANGCLKYWLDGNLVIHHEDILFRTAHHADMKFSQFLIAPYLPEPAQTEQVLWMDDIMTMSGILPPSWRPEAANQE